MNTQLYIENLLVEIDKSVQFALTRQFEDLSNPTKIINSWSKTVKIPGTVSNNNLFGNIFRHDKLISKSASSVIGINFDPSRKLDFKLIYNNDILMSGYAKLNTIQNSNDNIWYEINLFGMLGKVLYDLQKLTFDKDAEDELYYIDGSQYVNENINASEIYEFWTREQRTDNLDIDSASVYDIIGWAPNNSYCEGFKYDTFLNSANSSKTFAEVLDGVPAFQANNISADTVIGNGLLPRQIGEYRSYQLLPYIYMNKLMQIFKKESERVTGYSVELDNMFFNSKNEYYKNLVMMLKPMKPTPSEAAVNYYQGNISSSTRIEWPGGGTGRPTYNVLKTGALSNNASKSLEIFQYYDFTNQRFNLTDTTSMHINIPFNFRLRMNDGGWERYLHFGKKNGLEISLKVTGANGQTSNNRILVVHQDTEVHFTESNYITVVRLPDTGTKVPNYFYWDFSVSIPQYFDKYTYGNWAKLSLTAVWLNNDPVAKHIATPFTPGTVLMLSNDYTAEMSYNTESFRSNQRYTLNTLWDNEHKLFDIILNYCKMFRIMIQVDDVNKKIKFVSSYTYFQQHTINDWTNKVNLNKDFIITPITADNKYLLFNYEDSKSNYNEKYSKQYGNNFGEKRFNTDYQFNDETTKLFETPLKTAIVNTDNVLSWSNLYSAGRIVYSFASELFVDCKDKDNKLIDVFGSMFLYAGLAKFSTEASLNMRTVRLTDDTDYQKSIETYFYSLDQGHSFIITTYPKLDIVNNGIMSTFAQPNVCYTYLNNYSQAISIYDAFWKLYLNEIYNIQNKKLTCYMSISPIDYMQFDFNHFVVIDNILYMINKIVDYDISNYEMTKVELIQISDTKNYWNNEYLFSLDSLDYIGSDSYIDWRVQPETEILIAETKSLSPVTFSDGKTSLSDAEAGYTLQIIDNNVYVTDIFKKYTEIQDIQTDYEIKNQSGNTGTVSVVRYSMRFYPYFEINGKKEGDDQNWIYDGNNEIAILIDGAEDSDLDVIPTITWTCEDPRSEGTFTFRNWHVETRIVNKWDEESQEYVEDFRPAWVGTMNASHWDQNAVHLTFILNGKLSGFTNTETFYIEP